MFVVTYLNYVPVYVICVAYRLRDHQYNLNETTITRPRVNIVT